jgi:hypothetical protein
MLGKVQEDNGANRKRGSNADRGTVGSIPSQVAPVSRSSPPGGPCRRLVFGEDSLFTHGRACLGIGPVVARGFNHPALRARGESIAQQLDLLRFQGRIIGAHGGTEIIRGRGIHRRCGGQRRYTFRAGNREMRLHNGSKVGRAFRMKGSINTREDSRGQGLHRDGIGKQESEQDRADHWWSGKGKWKGRRRAQGLRRRSQERIRDGRPSSCSTAEGNPIWRNVKFVRLRGAVLLDNVEARRRNPTQSRRMAGQSRGVATQSPSAIKSTASAEEGGPESNAGSPCVSRNTIAVEGAALEGRAWAASGSKSVSGRSKKAGNKASL